MIRVAKHKKEISSDENFWKENRNVVLHRLIFTATEYAKQKQRFSGGK